MKRSYKLSTLFGAVLISLVTFLVFYHEHSTTEGMLAGSVTQASTSNHVTKVIVGPMYVWSPYDCQVAARKTISISSRVGGGAVITYLVAEGHAVKKGAVLVKFDNTDIQRKLVQLKQDDDAARLGMESLQDAELPIELNDLKLKVEDQSNKVIQESKFLRDSESLAKQGLISEEELKQEKTEADKEQRKLHALKTKLDLTVRYIQPLRIQQARAKLMAADEKLKLGELQLKNSSIIAPETGVVEYQPIAISGEYRTVHIGDTVYRNQTILFLPDLHSLVADCDVPELEYDQVPLNAEVLIKPLLRPDIEFSGHVERVGSIARSLPGQPSWQRYFKLVVAIQGGLGVLKSGMSVTANILSYHNKHAIMVSRAAVHWNNDEPYVLVRELFGLKRRNIKLGHADLHNYEIRQGLKSGDMVSLQ